MVRHQVTAGADWRDAREVPHLFRAAAILRSVAPAFTQIRSLCERRAWMACETRHHRARALSHRSRRIRYPPRLALRRNGLAALAWTALLRRCRGDGRSIREVRGES